MNYQNDYDQPAVYANFGWRLLAYLIDGAILSVVSYLVMIILGGAIFAGMASSGSLEQLESGQMNEEMAAGILGGLFFFYLFAIGLAWLYYALMESSVKQGTIGKMALRMKVTDLNGDRISFGRASGRFFGKIVSSLIFMIGYIMQAFTEKSQALHDIMAGTLVLKEE